MESGNNNIKEKSEEILLTIEKNIFVGNQKASENKDLLIRNKINHLILIGNEYEVFYKEVNFL